MKKVLFVCLGNICRSPMAEGLFKYKINELGQSNEWESDSAGTAAYHVGESPDPRTMATLSQHGIDFQHAARQVNSRDAEDFDFIFAMDQNNFTDLKAILPDNFNGLYLMRAFDSEGTNGDVPDPYYGRNDGFDKVYQMLDRSINSFLNSELVNK